MSELNSLLQRVRACRHCEAHLPEAPRPVLRAGTGARVLVVGQAPGRRVHASGIPWDDPSGERLRQWLTVTPAEFYDPDQFAIVPMGFCYPGTGRSGDMPPRPECAPLWHGPLLEALPNIRLTLLIGQYAQRYYLKDKPKTLTETVHQCARHLESGYLALPHPSPRNNRWLAKNPWFEAEVLPLLRREVTAALGSNPAT